MDMYEICADVKVSAITPFAPDVCPIKDSPTINSPVVVEVLLILIREIFGAVALLLSADSKTPCTSIRSGTFREIVASWTLVP